MDRSVPLSIQWVPNEERMVELRVQSSGGEQCLLTPMGTAVPISALLEHLSEWLGSQDTPLGLKHSGRELDSAEILADLESGQARLSLEVVRAEVP